MKKKIILPKFKPMSDKEAKHLGLTSRQIRIVKAVVKKVLGKG